MARVLLWACLSDMLSVTPTNGPNGALQLHASTVAIDGQAVCITGPSGAGKSELALALMAYGATLVADDITWIKRAASGLMAHCPPTISGRIEARNVGILSADAAPPAPLALVVDLGRAETDRLPPRRHVTLLGVDTALLHSSASVYFPAIIWHYMRHGQAEYSA